MEQKAQDMTFEELRRISETAGPFNRLWLSGGEPTLREDLPEILEMFYKNNNIKDINFPSNGIRMDRVIEWIHRIRKNCPDANVTISISFDGFGKTHDAQRGVPSFYKAAECLKRIDDNFRDDGKVIKNVATVMTKYNVEEVRDFMAWVYGRFNATTHTIEAARGLTRDEGVKVLNEKSLRKIQDETAPYSLLYARRIGEGMSGRIAKALTEFFYVGLMRSMYNIRAENIDGPNSWNMDCTAGETTLVLDYDGRFRSCELRPAIGDIRDYNCDVQAIMNGPAMKKEVADIGHGYKANCWCTHGCWIMSSITFNPLKLVTRLWGGYREVKKLGKTQPVGVDEKILQALEDKYQLDKNKLADIGLFPGGFPDLPSPSEKADAAGVA